MVPRASVITIGNEVVHGRILNTNAQYLGRRLTILGFDVVLSASVPDRVELVVGVLDFAVRGLGSSVVVTTGGLGPTYDDITSEALSRYAGEEHVVNEEALRMVRAKYEARGVELTPERVKMALMPRSAQPLHNPVGTAPGILLRREGRIFVSLPGVPAEMQAIWERSVEPMLARLTMHTIAEETLVVRGVMESSAARIINRIIKERPRIYVKSQPKGFELGDPVLEIYIMTSSQNPREAVRECVSTCEELLRELKEIGGRVWSSCSCPEARQGSGAAPP